MLCRSEETCRVIQSPNVWRLMEEISKIYTISLELRFCEDSLPVFFNPGILLVHAVLTLKARPPAYGCMCCSPPWPHSLFYHSAKMANRNSLAAAASLNVFLYCHNGTFQTESRLGKNARGAGQQTSYELA